MDARELRLGNWLINFLGEEFQANADTIAYFDSNPLGKPRPIPLTAEWLERVGFVYEIIDENPYWVLKDDEGDIKCQIGIPHTQFWSYTVQYHIEEMGKNIHCVISLVEHLHQLQNLFSLLNEGEELTLKDVEKV